VCMGGVEWVRVYMKCDLIRLEKRGDGDAGKPNELTNE
jgi:hypothetical protein